jgi:hypothetical protein
VINSYAWTEFLPPEKSSIEVAGFPVMPGDRMFVEVFVTDNGEAAFFLSNESRGITRLITTPLAGNPVSLKQAVWIMERPGLTGQPSGVFGNPYTYLSFLSNYGSAFMSDAFAGRNDISGPAAIVSYLDSRTVDVTMIDKDGNNLSTATALDSSNMRFDWKAFGDNVVVPNP